MSCCEGSVEIEEVVTEPVNKIVKIVILGNCGVGKTTLIDALVRGNNMGVAYHEPTIPQKCSGGTYSFDGAYVNTTFGKISCNIWDTAGQEKYRSLTPIYLRNADICIVCHSLIDNQSKIDVKSWEELIDKYSPNATVVVVGTKSDLVSRYRYVSPVEDTNETDTNPIHRSDDIVSSLNGEGIRELKNSLSVIASLVMA